MLDWKFIFLSGPFRAPFLDMTSPNSENPATPRAPSSDVQQRLQSLALERPTDRKPRRLFRWLVLFLLLVGLAFGAIRAIPADSPWRMLLAARLHGTMLEPWVAPTTECEIIVVKSEQTDDFVLEANGFVTARSKIHLNPSVPGKIVELPIREGEKVKQGDVIVRIDDSQYRADLNQATAGLELAQARLRELREGTPKEEIAQARAVVDQAKARLELLDAELKRAELLRESISTAEYEKAKTGRDEAVAHLEQTKQSLASAEAGPRPVQIQVAEAEVDRAQAALDKAKHWMESTVVYSPVSGTVLQKSAELGEYIRPESLVHGLCVVADLNDVEVEVDVQERDLALVKVGQPCRITAEAHGDHEFTGRVARILPIASRQRGAVQLRITVASADSRLLPDMNCRVMLLKDPGEQYETKGYRVPMMAVAKEGEKAFVFVLRNSAAHKVSVELGPVEADQIEIKKGINEGDRLLLARNGLLRDGQQVSVSDDLFN